MKANLKLPRPGTVIATIGVTVACAGTATAASMITGAQIKDSTVTSRDIKNGSLTTSDMNRQLRAQLQRQSASSSQPGAKGDKGDAGANGANGGQGEKGAQGERGATGATGPAGASTPQQIRSAPGEVATFSQDDVIEITSSDPENPNSIADVQFVEGGLWNITAKLGLQGDGPDDIVQCRMQTPGNAANGNVEQQAGYSPGASMDAPGVVAFELQSVFVMLTGQIVNLDCYDAVPNGGADAPASITSAGLVAERNGKITPLAEVAG